MATRAIIRAALKSAGHGGNVDALAKWVGQVGFDAAVAKLKDQIDPKTGQPYGEERAKKIIGKLKGMANRRGELKPEHSYSPAVREAAKAWGWRHLFKSATGEGSRGGHVIGHTRSGKAIYAHAGIDPAHPYRAGGSKGWTSLDHTDAASAHRREAERHEQTGSAKEMWHHRTHASYHEGHAVRLGGEERSREIGRTRSGKPIYDRFEHPRHQTFTAADHHDAYKLNQQKADHEWEANPESRRAGSFTAFDEHGRNAHLHRAAHAVAYNQENATKSWSWRALFKSTDNRPTCPHCGHKANKVKVDGDQPVAYCDACDRRFPIKGHEKPDSDADGDAKAKPPLGSGERFAHLKEEISHEKGARDAGAIAAAIGRKKYGATKMAQLSTAGRGKAWGWRALLGG